MNHLDPPKAYLGVGWSAPLALDGRGEIVMAAYEEDVRQSILIILGTEPGERVMRPDFGAGLRALAFEPLNEVTMALAQDRVERGLIAWEPRIVLNEVAVAVDCYRPELGRLRIEIAYTVRATNNAFNFVYPFCLAEGADS